MEQAERRPYGFNMRELSSVISVSEMAMVAIVALVLERDDYKEATAWACASVRNYLVDTGRWEHVAQRLAESLYAETISVIEIERRERGIGHEREATNPDGSIVRRVE